MSKKPFFYRIDAADLLDFATDPEAEGVTLLKFAKDLVKGESDISYIQGLIDEAHDFIEKRRNSGRLGGLAKSSTAKANPSTAKANPSEPLASSSSSSSSSTETKRKTYTPPNPPTGGTGRFQVPTVQEVAAYCSERDNGVIAEKFHAHYQSKGWMVGKNKMKDWKAAVRTWEDGKPKMTPEQKRHAEFMKGY